jgi:antitoxin PrlF
LVEEFLNFLLYDFPMTRTTLRAKGQLTLPEEVRTAARLQEGDLLDAVITAEGILLRPQKVIDSTQAWFWTPEWQAGEREADEDLRAGRTEAFSSGAALIAGLKAIARTNTEPPAPASRRKRR